MGLKPRRANQKNPPFFSHDFIIVNHADIVSCIAMVFVVGLMFQVTAPFASLFVAVNHNGAADSADDSQATEKSVYTYGIKDVPCVFFYFLIAIIVHAVVQEYAVDRMNRKLRLSKVNHRKFNESSQLLFFYIASALWGLNVALREGLLWEPRAMWSNYPEAHSKMSFQHKFFFIIQIAYWLHQFPELYFQKVKKDEMWQRIQLSLMYLLPITTAYLLNFTKLALVLLVVHYASETVTHVARILNFASSSAMSKKVFFVSNALYVPVRLITIVASVLTFHFGLAKEKQGLDAANGNYNVQFVRVSCLVSVCALQAWLLWTFTTFHLRKRRERAQAEQSKEKTKTRLRPKKTKQSDSDDVNELPEVDQNTSKVLRQRKVNAK